MSGPGESAAPAPAGRPRDPEVDERITRAAAEVFGEDGWARFTVDAVARRAGVGKASIYLRWPNKEALLASAVARRVDRVADIDTGTVRGDLVRLAEQMLSSYLDSEGAAIRLMVDAERIPGVVEQLAEYRESQVLAARAIVRRAIGRGELEAGTGITVLLDALCGGVLNHVLATPAHLRERVAAKADEYVAELVDFLLRAVGAQPAG